MVIRSSPQKNIPTQPKPKANMSTNFVLPNTTIPALLAVSAATTATAITVLRLSRQRPIRLNLDDDENININNVNTRHQHQPERCRFCNGFGTQPCRLCEGQGALKRGGFSRRNYVRVNDLVGSKWTSVHAIDGKWRHFLCVGKRGTNAKNGVAVLSSTCGPVDKRISIDVPVKTLKLRDAWQAGWTTMTDIRTSQNIGDRAGRTRCSGCRGEGVVLCPRCEGLGQLGLL